MSTETSPTRQADQVFCYSCGKVLHNSALSCPGCGAELTHKGSSHTQVTTLTENQDDRTSQPLKLNHKYCYGCGGQVHTSATNCPKCGAAQNREGLGTKNKITAGLLGLFLGGFGAHHFYLRNFIQATIYLLLFWTYIPFIIGFIEGIVYLCSSDENFNRKYNKT